MGGLLGGGSKGTLPPPPSKLLGGLAPLAPPPPPLPTPMDIYTVFILLSRYFTDPDLLDRVPTCFLILAGSYAAMQILGIIMVTRPPVNRMAVNVSKLQSTLVTSKSKGPSETLRDIHTSTYQICIIEENKNRTTKFHK